MTILRDPWSQFQSSFHYYTCKTVDVSAVCKHVPRAMIGAHRVWDASSYLLKCSKNLNRSIPYYFR